MAPIRRVSNIEIEHAQIIFKNFAGQERGRYNRAGDRNFGVIIEDPQQAQELIKDGWNVRLTNPRDEYDIPKHYINVSINYNFWKRPEIYMISNGVKTLMDEEEIGMLDGATFINADLIIRPRQWDDDGETRVKAYLQELYVTIERSRFADKYAD